MSSQSTLQMTATTLNALKGWPTMNAVDFQAPLDSSITVALPPGSVVHVSSTLTFLPGLSGSVMPMFTFQGSSDADVTLPSGGNPATTVGVFVGIEPGGNINALVATGAYELVSTNFDTNYSYAPNSLLTSPLVITGTTAAGQLYPGTISTNNICGVVSRGVVDNGYGVNAVAFWPVYLPASL